MFILFSLSLSLSLRFQLLVCSTLCDRERSLLWGIRPVCVLVCVTGKIGRDNMLTSFSHHQVVQVHSHKLVDKNSHVHCSVDYVVEIDSTVFLTSLFYSCH